MDLIKIIETITKLTTLASIMNKFLSRESTIDTSLRGPTLTEMKNAIDEQKFTYKIIDKFFQGSRLEDITMRFSDISRYIKDQDQLGIRSLLVPFFFNRDGRIIKTDEIKANYLDIYNDISNLKENFEKVKIPNRVDIKDIVYTVAHGTMDWIRDGRISLIVNGWGDGEGDIDIYKLTWASKDQFDMLYNGKTYSGNIAILVIDNQIHNFTFLAVKDTVIRSDIIWCLEFVADGK